MATTTFDTLKLARGPEAAAALAGRADVGDRRRELRQSRVRLENRVQAMKAEVLTWMFGAMAARTGIIVALLTLLPKRGIALSSVFPAMPGRDTLLLMRRI